MNYSAFTSLILLILFFYSYEYPSNAKSLIGVFADILSTIFYIAPLWDIVNLQSCFLSCLLEEIFEGEKLGRIVHLFVNECLYFELLLDVVRYSSAGLIYHCNFHFVCFIFLVSLICRDYLWFLRTLHPLFVFKCS